MTEPKRRKARPAMGGRIIAFGLSFSVALALLSKLVVDQPPPAAATVAPPAARQVVATAPPKVIVRVLHRRSGKTVRSTQTAGQPTTVVRRVVSAPAPAAVTTTHVS
ncbi:MAG: hypothetical protein ACXVD8_09640 [Actinomycetota bacterium]